MMMHMKRLMIAVMSLALAAPAVAQYHEPPRYNGPSRQYHSPHSSFSDAEIYYGLRLGLGLATVKSDDSRLDGGSIQAGLNVGAVVGFQLGYRSPVYLETGLLYVEKGGEGKYNGSKFTYGLKYLELPVVMKYEIDLNPAFSIQPFFGGFMALGVGGKIKDFDNRKAYSSFDDDGFQRFDAGLRLGCGVQYDRLYGELGYDIGLANISRDYFDSSHTGMFFATIGVNF